MIETLALPFIAFMLVATWLFVQRLTAKSRREEDAAKAEQELSARRTKAQARRTARSPRR